MSGKRLPPGTDEHHLLSERVVWESRPESKRLRRTGALIFLLDRGGHEELHANTSPVPMLTYPLLQRTIRGFYPSREPLENVDNLAWAMEQAADAPTMREVEHNLGYLAAQAVRDQRPYIADALVIPDTRTIIDLAA